MHLKNSPNLNAFRKCKFRDVFNSFGIQIMHLKVHLKIHFTHIFQPNNKVYLEVHYK